MTEQKTDRWSLPLQGHKSWREKEGHDNRKKIRGAGGCGTTREREREDRESLRQSVMV